jgi:hypothetical protein
MRSDLEAVVVLNLLRSFIRSRRTAPASGTNVGGLPPGRVKVGISSAQGVPRSGMGRTVLVLKCPNCVLAMRISRPTYLETGWSEVFSRARAEVHSRGPWADLYVAASPSCLAYQGRHQRKGDPRCRLLQARGMTEECHGFCRGPGYAESHHGIPGSPVRSNHGFPGSSRPYALTDLFEERAEDRPWLATVQSSKEER